MELVGNKDWTELTAVGTGPSVVCCVPPHACRSLQTQLRVHKLPAVSADPAAQASAPRMAPPPAPAPSPGPAVPPTTQLEARGGSHAPSAGPTLCCKHPVYSHLFIRKPIAQEQPGGRVHRARHGGHRTTHPVQLCPLPAPGLLTWESHHEGILCRLRYLSVAD